MCNEGASDAVGLYIFLLNHSLGAHFLKKNIKTS